MGAIAYCVLRIGYCVICVLDGRLWMELRIAYWLLRVNAPVKLTLHSIDSYCTAVRVILLTSKFNASNMREREMINRHSNILRSTNKEYMPIAIYRSEYDCIQITVYSYTLYLYVIGVKVNRYRTGDLVPSRASRAVQLCIDPNVYMNKGS